MTDTPASAGLCDVGFGSRPTSPIKLPKSPSSAWLATLKGSFVAFRVGGGDMYPNRSAHREVTKGNGNHDNSIFVPWNRRSSGFNARTLSLISSGGSCG